MSISGPDFYSVTSTDRSATQVPADSVNKAKIVNLSGGTLYYKNASDVSSSSSDGNLTSGQTVTVSATNWIITTSAVNVGIFPITGLSLSGDETFAGNEAVTGTLAVTGATTLTGAATTTGGITPPSAPTGIANWQAVAATSGTDTTPADGTQFVTSIWVPANKTITNINYLIGTVGGTNKVYGVLYNSAGTNVKNTSLTSGGATVGTAANVQTLALTSTYAAVGPARYFVGISINGGTARLRTVPIHTQAGVYSGTVSQTHGSSPTVAAITPPSAFADATAPVVFLD